MKGLGCLVGVLALVASGCGAVPAGDDPAPAVTLLFAGDLMLGRDVEPVATADPVGLFEDVRFVVGEADIAAVNLESPLTTRPHLDPGVPALEASPAVADLVAAAGFDVLGLANNHAGDAGRPGILDSVHAVGAAGLVPVGAGRDAVESLAPVVVERGGIRVAYLAFDATGRAPAAGEGPGVATWDAVAAEAAVARARAVADVVAVGVHGGIEHLSETDRNLARIAERLAGWGADIVWGHGAHVVQPVYTIETADRVTVVATSLGNFLFDQAQARRGAVLEVLAGADGVRAFRTGTVEHEDLRVHFVGWTEPAGAAVYLAGSWWALLAETNASERASAATLSRFQGGDGTAAGAGSVTGPDARELVVSFRRPLRETLVNRAYPDIVWADADGRSAHLGVYDLDTLESRWVAGSLSRPVAALAVCDGSIALAFGSFDSTDVAAAGAWVWDGFGFRYSPELAGPGRAACADADGDGLLEPAVVDRGGLS